MGNPYKKSAEMYKIRDAFCFSISLEAIRISSCVEIVHFFTIAFYAFIPNHKIIVNFINSGSISAGGHLSLPLANRRQ